jgi:hypothetical protein
MIQLWAVAATASQWPSLASLCSEPLQCTKSSPVIVIQAVEDTETYTSGGFGYSSFRQVDALMNI